MDDGDITNTITDIFFYDSTHGWAVGASDILYCNTGIWTQLNNPSGQSLYSVFFLNQNEGWIVGNGGTILHSTDGGAIWSSQSSGTSATLRDVFFTSPENGYAVGNSGTILRYTQITEVEEHPAQPAKFQLYQNYPNPFNPSTTISFSLPFKSFVSLKVCDALGREVSNLIAEELRGGTYTQEWNAADFSSGVYFYRLQAGSFSETKKLMLLR